MAFTLRIETENDAFACGADFQVARLLRQCAARVEAGHTEGNLRDSNGNTVGRFELEA